MAIQPQDKNIIIKRYSPENKEQWDLCVTNASNSHFMFYRDYMEYHSDRFKDHSVMVLMDNKLIGVLPASESDKTITSHGGLTFGGFIHPFKTTAPQVISSLFRIAEYYRNLGYKEIIYKPSPWTYHSYPCEADKYALKLLGAHITEIQLATTINYANQVKFSGGRKNQIQRAKKNNAFIEESSDLESFFDLLNIILYQRHGVKPVHSPSEMRLLQSRFPENIKLWIAKVEDRLLAGTILFITPTAIHTQYLASSDEGCHLGALDLLLSHLILNYGLTKRFFCFGTSTENDGRILNEGLLFQKESFGGRSVVHEIWKIDLN